MKWQVLLVSLLLVPFAFAHVGYVLDDEEIARTSGQDFQYLLGAFEPMNILLMAITIVVVVGLYFFLPRLKFFRTEMEKILQETKTYDIFLPWIARLGLGIALIGAGSADVLISPALDAGGLLSFLQILIGFLLLAGAFTGISTWVAIGIFIVGVSQDFYLVGNLDFLGLCLALIALRDSQPGVDDLVGIPFFLGIKRLGKYVPLLCRLGIGIGMAFLAIYEKLLNPHMSQLVVEHYQLTSVIPVSPELWVVAAGLIELAVALLLLFGFKTRLSAAIAFIVLTASFFYFGEGVYSHITLFATLSILFVTGGGRMSIDKMS